MIVAQREAIAERLPRLLPKLDDFQLADHVRARLPRIHDVPFDFACLDPVIDALLARPLLGVEPGIDDQAPRAEQLLIELPQQSLDVAFIPAALRREALGVEAPSFPDGGDDAEGAELKEPLEVLILDLQRDVEVMAGHRLVVDGAPQPELRHVLDAPRVLKDARARSVRGGRVVVGRGVRLAKGREWPCDNG